MNYYNDFDKNACAWLRELIKAGIIPPGDVDDRPIQEVKPNDLKGYTQCHFFAGVGGWPIALGMASWPADEPVWSGSCPCQPYSSAGKQKGDADERNLWPEFFRLIRECSPVTIFGEQVKNAIGHGWLDGISADLESAGYTCGAAVLGAHSVGAPHIRQRLFWVADAERDGRWANESEREAQGGDVDRGDCGWMAHTTSSRLITKRQGSEIEARNETRMRGFECGCTDSWLENPNRNGRDKRRAECQGFERWDAFERTSANRGLGNTCGPGLEKRKRFGRVQPETECGVKVETTVLSGDNCGMVNADGARRAACSVYGLRVKQVGHNHIQSSTMAPGAWDDYILIPCADGKARRIVARFALLADGLLDSTPIVCDEGEIDAEKSDSRSSKNVFSLRECDEEKALQRKVGGYIDLSEKKILQPTLHGAGDDGNNQISDTNKQPSSVAETEQRILRELRENRNATLRSPQRRKPNEQQRDELSNIMRLMPSAYARAFLEGDTKTCEALRLLFPASLPRESMQYSSLQNAKAWKSPDCKEVERAWRAGLFRKFGVIPCKPLVDGLPGRASLLRGYGNAIVPACAAEFIKAFIGVVL